MGQPVVHFEVIGDGARLQSYYSELFGWQIHSENPMGYGIVQRDGNTNSTASASAAAWPAGRRATAGT